MARIAKALVGIAGSITLVLSLTPPFALANPPANPAAAIEASAASVSAESDNTAMQQVMRLIEALPAIRDVTADDAAQIQAARAAYDALDAADQSYLDSLSDPSRLSNTQSYGRNLEMAEAGLAVLQPVNNETSLADGTYTSDASFVWDRGKSASKQVRDWSLARLTAAGGKVTATLSIDSATYRYVRINGQTYRKDATSPSGTSQFTVPVPLNKQFTFLAWSDTMAAEIAYNATITIDERTAVADKDGQDSGDTPSDPGQGDSSTVTTHTDADDNVVAAAGAYTHPQQSAYMFRIVDTTIYSDGDTMMARITMPSTSYTYARMGTSEDATAATEAAGGADQVAQTKGVIVATTVTNSENAQASQFVIPVASLNKPIQFAVWTRTNRHWLQQTVTFSSDELTRASDTQLQDVIRQLDSLPARYDIDPNSVEDKAAVDAVRDAYEALLPQQKALVPQGLADLLTWDENIFKLGFNTDYPSMAVVGQPYGGVIYTGGADPKQIRVVAGMLPEGVSIAMNPNGKRAEFSGTPTTVGAYPITLELTNETDDPVRQDFVIYVGYAPRNLTESLPAGTIGEPYQATVTADAYPDATWTLTGGSLPDGLMFTDAGEASNDAAIVGTPTTAGTYTFTLTCDNYANGFETRTYEVTIAEAGATSESESTPAGQDEPASATTDEPGASDATGANGSTASTASITSTASTISTSATNGVSAKGPSSSTTSPQTSDTVGVRTVVLAIAACAGIAAIAIGIVMLRRNRRSGRR